MMKVEGRPFRTQTLGFCLGLASALFMALGLFTESGLAQQGATGGEWRSYGGDIGSTKYSPLDQINRDNLGDLRIAWQWESVDGRFDLDRLREDYPNLQVPNDIAAVRISNLKATPLMVGGVLYISTPLSQSRRSRLPPARRSGLTIRGAMRRAFRP